MNLKRSVLSFFQGVNSHSEDILRSQITRKDGLERNTSSDGSHVSASQDEESSRIRIDSSENVSKFRPGDVVYVRISETGRFEDGPYKIAYVPSASRYVLCLSDGQTAKDGVIFDEKDLHRAEGTQTELR
ncbi:MAG: hypothetical protein Q9157_006593 [Trypethelium eluteriae]